MTDDITYKPNDKLELPYYWHDEETGNTYKFRTRDAAEAYRERTLGRRR